MIGRYGVWLRTYPTGHTLFTARGKIRGAIDEWVRQAIECAEPLNYLGKRCHTRYGPWLAPIELASGDETLVAHGRDISAEGLGITCRYEFDCGEIVQMRCVGDGLWVPLRVRHCTNTVGGYKIGARFLVS